MATKDYPALINQEQSLMRKIALAEIGEGAPKILYRGLVALVDRVGTATRPRFSLKVKVFGIDDPNVNDLTKLRYFPPLFPIHLNALPEVGEEVILICEEVGDLSTAYWVSRTNTLNKSTFSESGGDIAIDEQYQTKKGKYGNVQLPKETIDDTPDPNYPESNPRIKPGDNFQIGRSNTHVRHSFDLKNKKGLIELVTEEDPRQDSGIFTDEFRTSNGSRMLLTTLCDIDTKIIGDLYNLKFYEGQGDNSTPYRESKNIDAAYLLVEALELRLVSRAGKDVQHAVLAESQEEWLRDLIDLIKLLIDYIIAHKHMANGPTSPPLVNDVTNFQNNQADFLEHKEPIKEHHSTKVALN